MADKLTDKQRQAVFNRGGNLLISAAAGSGKTKVLVERLMSYITDPDDPANVDDFLIVTFTNAAAAELRSKIAAAMSERIAQQPDNAHLHDQMRRLYMAKISTVHGFCGDILKENAYKLDIPGDFRVAEQTEADELQQEAVWSVLENAYENAWQDEEIQSFLDGNELSRSDLNLAQILYDVYKSASCHVDPEGWLDECVSWAQVDDITDASQTIWGRYLIDDLHRHLKMHIDAIGRCLLVVRKEPALDKAAAVMEEEQKIYGDICSLNTWDEIVSAINFKYASLTFPRKYEDADFIESIKAVRNAAKDYLQKKAMKNFAAYSVQILSDLSSTVDVTKGLVKLVKDYMHTYDRMKKSHHILDFNDLEHKTLDLLWGKSRNHITALAKEIGGRFREVMVDEYQDTNAVQDGIFMALTAEKNNCFMVGDVKQSIYQFRLADPGIFLDRYNRYLSADIAEFGQDRKVILSDNFRSSAGVIDGVNDVFSVCMSERVGGIAYTEDEMLREGIPHDSLGEPEVELYAIDAIEEAPEEEAAFVAQRIEALLDGSHMIRTKDGLRAIQPEDIVILLRSTKSSAGFFFYALRNAGIPCASGGNGDILLTEEVSALHALLQTISNPRQDVPLLAALVSRIFRFTANDLANIRLARGGGGLYNAVKASNLEKAAEFVHILEELRERSRICDAAELISHIIYATRFDSIYGALESGDQRRDNIRKFMEYAYRYCANGHRTLDQFLSHLDAVKVIMTEDSKAKAGGVCIDTIHSSKGLEYPVVFLCALSHNIRFEDNKRQVICHKKLGIGFNCLDMEQRVHHPSIAKRAIIKKCEEDTLCEEMRLLYVAMTRPKDRLIMTYSVKNLAKDLGGTIQLMPFASSEQICSAAKCLGDWVMYSALQKTESGALYAIAGNPHMGRTGANPWHVEVVSGIENTEVATVASIDENQELDLHHLAQDMVYRYPYSNVTKIPSKLTATQIKGRAIDNEVAENTVQKRHGDFHWRVPLVKQNETASTAYGTAIHKIMEHIDFAFCDTKEGISQEIQRMCQAGLITEEQAAAADRDGIFAFFQTPIGQLALTGEKVYREFKFSVLAEADKYYPDSTGEQVLLQGVIDFAVMDGNDICLVDFKTDFVTDETLPHVAGQYKNQVLAYKNALEKIFGRPVKASQLYFFRLKQLVDVV